VLVSYIVCEVGTNPTVPVGLFRIGALKRHLKFLIDMLAIFIHTLLTFFKALAVR
jgi:hypothetical protein